MTKYIVHIYREMRVSYTGIEADTPEAAAAIAHAMPTDEADDIEECNGDDLSALVDVAGDEDYRHSVTIDFEPERIRKAAPSLLAALWGVIHYAENEASSLESLKDSPEAEAEAEKAWRAIEAAQTAIAEAKSAGMALSDLDLHAFAANRRQIASLWSVEDVQSIRPDLTEGQAWEVLQSAEKGHDATIGINWEVLGCHAEMLFGDAPDTDNPEVT
jgi:hypothetical protein